MFEQQSYDRATVPTPTQPGELFHNYEIKNWVLSPTMYKLLAFSAVLNLAVLGFVAQTSMLTLRGCDSPWVGRVCQVLDMAYVGAMIYGTDREFVDEAYENIDLGEAEITFIDVTGDTPPLSYPEGYFQIANPVQYAMLRQAAENPAAGMPNAYQPYTPPSTYSSGQPDLMNIQPNPPAANPNAFKDDSSSGLFKVDNNTPNSGRVARNKGRGGKIRPNSNTNTATPNETVVAGNNANAQPTPAADPTAPVDDLVINRAPFKDLAMKLLERSAKNELNLAPPFLVRASGKLDPDGKIRKPFRYIQAAGDEQMIKDVQAGIEAFNDSGFLKHISMLSGKTLEMTLQQDDQNLSGQVKSEVESETRANTLSSLLNSFLVGAVKKKEDQIAELEKENNPEKLTQLQNVRDDLQLLKNLKVATDGKNLVINFGIQKDIVLAMIKRKLDEQAAESKKPSGSTTVSANSSTSAAK